LFRQLKDLGAAPEDICVVLHSDRSNNERQANLERFKAGKSRFLVCTDVAARGIDVKGLPFIISTLKMAIFYYLVNTPIRLYPAR